MENIENNEQILNILKPNNNNLISSLEPKYLNALLYHINNFYLVLQDQSNYNSNTAFGGEIEFEHSDNDSINIDLQKNNLSPYNYRQKLVIQNSSIKGYETKIDVSLENGAEIATPILLNKKQYWQDLKEVLSIIDKHSIVGPNASSHIAIETNTLGEDPNAWMNLIKLWSTYENIIFRFSYGEFLTPRPKINKYAQPLAQRFREDYDYLSKINCLDTDTILKKIEHKRKQAINFSHVLNYNERMDYNFIEIRCPNPTFDPIIWQNNINFFVNILNYAKNPNFNMEIVDKRAKKIEAMNLTLHDYNNIYINQAIEFADLIFTTNIDKIYFLRQYFKSFEFSKKPFQKAKKFTLK